MLPSLDFFQIIDCFLNDFLQLFIICDCPDFGKFVQLVHVEQVGCSNLIY